MYKKPSEYEGDDRQVQTHAPCQERWTGLLQGGVEKKPDATGGTITGVRRRVEGDTHVANLNIRVDEDLKIPEKRYNYITLK